MDRDYEPNPDDEREVDLSDEAVAEVPPPTIDPDERIEDDEPDDLPDEERMV